MSEDEKIRLDKWLWAARFFKTRSLAAEAIQGGKVHLNGQRVKAAKEVHIGQVLRNENLITQETLCLARKCHIIPPAIPAVSILFL